MYLIWLLWVSVKIMINVSWILQNSSARSRFKRSLMPPIWSYIMLQPLKNERKKISLIVIRMVLGLLKWLKETRFYERKKKIRHDIYWLHELFTKGKFIPKKEEEFINFWIKEKFMLRISGSKRGSFSTQEVGRKKKLVRCFKKWESYISVLKSKKTKKQN